MDKLLVGIVQLYHFTEDYKQENIYGWTIPLFSQKLSNCELQYSVPSSVLRYFIDLLNIFF